MRWKERDTRGGRDKSGTASLPVSSEVSKNQVCYLLGLLPLNPDNFGGWSSMYSASMIMNKGSERVWSLFPFD